MPTFTSKLSLLPWTVLTVTLASHTHFNHRYKVVHCIRGDTNVAYCNDLKVSSRLFDENVAQITGNVVMSLHFQSSFYRKSISLRTTVTAGGKLAHAETHVLTVV